MSLRRGGGLQVMAGLVSRFSEHNRYTVLWADPQSREMFGKIAGERPNVAFANPLGSSGNAAIFGSADGYVYCLRVGDGKLAWRYRVAPSDLRTVSYGQRESVWPGAGSVLLQDGRVYCRAG